MHDDINTKRTELANNLAAAGAALLNFTGTAAALAAIPNTDPQQYAAAGTPEDIAKILPATICPQRRQKHGERPTEPLSWEDSAALPADLQQLKALALAYEYENNGVWYSIHQLADGITYEPAANFVAAANPAAVLDLFARIERAAAPTDAEVVVNGQIARRESIAANHDAMIILTQSYPREAVIRVVDAHTERNVAAALASQRAASPVSGDPHGTWAEVMKRVGPALKSGNLPTFERYSSDGFGGSALDSKGRFYLATDVDAELARSAAVSASQAAPTVEPIYQVRYETEKDSSAWHDATEDAYHTFVPERRRIVYAASLARKAPEGLAMLCDQLLDIWDDGRRNAPEDRAYSEGALDEVIEEIRESFAAPVASQAAPVGGELPSIDVAEFRERLRGLAGRIDVHSDQYKQFVGCINRHVSAAVAAAKVPTAEPFAYVYVGKYLVFADQLKDLFIIDKGALEPLYKTAAPVEQGHGAAVEDASLRADEATRLRRVVNLLGLQAQVPGNDASLRDCLFSVLGLVARKLEEQGAAPSEKAAGASAGEVKGGAA